MTAIKNWVIDRFRIDKEGPVISESQIQHMREVADASEKRIHRIQQRRRDRDETIQRMMTDVSVANRKRGRG